MPIEVTVEFTEDLRNVWVTDLFAGEVFGSWDVHSGDRRKLEVRREDGKAWIAVSGETLNGEPRNGEKLLATEPFQYQFPEESSRSALDEIAGFASLDELARRIDEIIKNTPPVAKASGSAESSHSRPELPK
jgi:hypothetical protein